MKNKKGFTLVEILTVVALIAILFVIFVPKIDFATTKTREVGVRSDFRSYEMAFQSVAMQKIGFTDFEDNDDLVKSLNSYLDPAMQIKVVENKLITDKKDPWNVKYSFVWDTENNSVSVVSAGKDKSFTESADDNYSLTVTYNSNGYIDIATAGFDSNIGTGSAAVVSGVINPTTPNTPAPVASPAIWFNIDSDNVLTGLTDVGRGAINGGETDIVIPNTVTSIGGNAFYSCTNLTSVTIPEGVKSIGAGAFRDCRNLTSVIIPKGVTSIGNHAFCGCNLKSVTIPEGVKSIGDAAFSGCNKLETITIPSTVNSIGYCVIQFCTSLKSITIPSTVSSIGDYAFQSCTSLTSINFEGTTEQWNYDVNKGTSWNKNVPATVVKCSDGNAAL